MKHLELHLNETKTYTVDVKHAIGTGAKQIAFAEEIDTRYLYNTTLHMLKVCNTMKTIPFECRFRKLYGFVMTSHLDGSETGRTAEC